jgi:hypothetical protein
MRRGRRFWKYNPVMALNVSQPIRIRDNVWFEHPDYGELLWGTVIGFYVDATLEGPMAIIEWMYENVKTRRVCPAFAWNPNTGISEYIEFDTAVSYFTNQNHCLVWVKKVLESEGKIY